MKVKILFLVVCILISLDSALVRGLSINKYKLDFSVTPGESSIESLTVINTDSHPLKYQLLVKGDYQEWFSFSDDNFSLQPGQKRTVFITVSPPKSTLKGSYSTKIGVLSQANNGGNSRLNTGIKIPANIVVLGADEGLMTAFNINNSTLQLGIVAIAFLAVLSLFFVDRSRKLSRMKEEEVMP